MRLLEAVVALVVSGAAWLIFIPWDMRNRATSPGLDETTPITWWGSVLFGLTLLVIAGALGWRGWRTWLAGSVVAAAPMALMMASFVTHPILDADIWPVPWTFFSALMIAGGAAATAVGQRLGSNRRAATA